MVIKMVTTGANFLCLQTLLWENSFLLNFKFGWNKQKWKLFTGVTPHFLLIPILSNEVPDSFYSYQIRSVTQSCPIFCDPMIHSTPGLPVHHQLPEFTQTHDHRVSGAIQPSHPLSSPSPPAPNPSQHQSLFQWVNSSHEVAKVLDFQLQHHSF